MTRSDVSVWSDRDSCSGPLALEAGRLTTRLSRLYCRIDLVITSLKTGHSCYLRSLLSSASHRFTRSSSVITLNHPSVTSGLKFSNRSFYHSAPVLWNSLPSHLRYAAQHSTSLPTSGSCIPDLSIHLLLKKLKSHLFRISFPP